MLLSLLRLIRLLIGSLDLFILTTIMYLLTFLPSRLLTNWYRQLFRYWCWVFIRALDAKLYLHQKNHHPLPAQYILIANHPSVFEDLGMSALFNVRFLAKEEMKDWWILGRISKATGTYFVKRDNKLSRQEAADDLRLALTQGNSIGLYPEGGCKGRRIFIPFRYGAFELAMQTGVPIVPVFLHYEAQADFEWQYQSLIYKLWMILKAENRRANYYLFDAIDPKQFASKEVLCQHVQNLYLGWQKQYLE